MFGEETMQELALFQDGRWTSAKQKHAILNRWIKFLESDLARDAFKKNLYEHLHLRCGFIAHFNIDGFYQTYFTTGEGKMRFLSHFDIRLAEEDGDLPSERNTGWNKTYWLHHPDCEDLTREMVRVAKNYIPDLMEKAKAEQRSADLAEATRLLRKHGIEAGFS